MYSESVKNDIEDTGWITLSETYGVTYRRKAGIVFVRANYNGGSSDAQIVTGTLPAEYRPDVAVIVSNYSPVDVSNPQYMSIATSGAVAFNGGGRKFFNCIISYPVS